MRPDEQASPAAVKIPGLLWLQQAVRLVLFPVALMWPAGTWRWGAAWAVVGVWMLFGAAITVFLLGHDRALLAERMKGSPIQEGQKTWDKVATLLIFVAGIGLFVVPGLDVMRFGWTTPLPAWVQALALAMHLPAFLLLGWVLRENAFLSKVVKIDEERGHEVVTSGPYAFVRHPMYTAVVVIVFALPLALGSRVALIPAALLVTLLVVRTALEDRTLHDELPGYPEYAARTRYRLVPGLW